MTHGKSHTILFCDSDSLLECVSELYQNLSSNEFFTRTLTFLYFNFSFIINKKIIIIVIIIIIIIIIILFILFTVNLNSLEFPRIQFKFTFFVLMKKLKCWLNTALKMLRYRFYCFLSKEISTPTYSYC